MEPCRERRLDDLPKDILIMMLKQSPTFRFESSKVGRDNVLTVYLSDCRSSLPILSVTIDSVDDQNRYYSKFLTAIIQAISTNDFTLLPFTEANNAYEIATTCGRLEDKEWTFDLVIDYSRDGQASNHLALHQDNKSKHYLQFYDGRGGYNDNMRISLPLEQCDIPSLVTALKTVLESILQHK